MTKKDEVPVFEEESTALAIKPDHIEKHDRNKTELEQEITKIVDEVIHSDLRLENTPEVREALRDYVRVEIIFSMKIAQAVKNIESITTADERMIRAAAKIKMDLRNELWQNVRGEPGKDRTMNITRELINRKVIKAKKEVDPLG
jgi:hypothetical protein